MATKKKKKSNKAAPRKKSKKAAPKKKRRKQSFAYGAKSIGPLRLAAIVNRDAPANPGAAWNAMMPLMQDESRRLSGAGTQALAAFVTQSASDPKAIQWYAASIAVDDDRPIAAPLEEVTVPQGSYAAWTYVGKYEGLGEAWGWFTGHVANIGHTIDLGRPFLEIYKSDGRSAKDKLPRTELCIPV